MKPGDVRTRLLLLRPDRCGATPCLSGADVGRHVQTERLCQSAAHVTASKPFHVTRANGSLA